MRKFVLVVILLVVLYYLRKPIISQVNFYKVNQLHPKVKNDVINFLSDVEKELDFIPIVVSTYRNFYEQQKLWEQNNNNAKAGFSFHNYGMGIDVSFQRGTELINKSSSKDEWINSGIIEIANRYNLRCGINFDDNNHFDFGNFYNINYLYTLAINTGKPIEEVEGNKLILV